MSSYNNIIISGNFIPEVLGGVYKFITHTSGFFQTRIIIIKSVNNFRQVLIVSMQGG